MALIKELKLIRRHNWFLNSDDISADEKAIKKISDAFDKKTDCVFGDLIYTDSKDKIKEFGKVRI